MNRATDTVRKRRQKVLDPIDLADTAHARKGFALYGGGPFYVDVDQLEASGYVVVSNRYLARLENVAKSTFAFLEGEFDQETLMEELTDG
jgi:hypothetical protein